MNRITAEDIAVAEFMETQYVPRSRRQRMGGFVSPMVLGLVV